jgi:Neurotransmitter-gated ion-channel ligand binding domain/Neurotransmitter-gated ion-channel transmembrane region
MEQLSEETPGLAAASSLRRLARAKTRRAQRSGLLLALAAILTGCLATPALAAPPRNAFPVDPNSMLLPPPTADGRVKVTVALHVLNLSMIREVTERFQLTGYLLAQWRDPRLTYQPTGPTDMYRMVAPDSVWRPRLVIINAVEPRQTDDISLRVEPDGLVSYVERFDTLVTSTFHLKAFPFDTQKLEVIVHPFSDQQQTVAFVPSQLPVWTATEFNTYSSLESWQFKSLTFNLSLAASQFGRHAISEARFELTVERRYGFYLWKVFLPLLLMVIMSWSVFWFDPPEASSQVTIAVTTILTIIAFALAISLTLPHVPYLTFADAFFLTCYIFAFVTMVEVTAVHVAYRNEQRKLAARIRYTARWLVPTTFVVTNAIVIAHFLA